TAGTGLSGGVITSSGTIGIAAGGVGSAQLAAGAVTSSAIAAGAVVNAGLGASAVTFDKISVAGAGCANGKIIKMSGGGRACQDDTSNPGTVTSITAGTGLSGGVITASGTIGIAAGGVGTAQLADGSVTPAKMAACGDQQFPKYVVGTGW